MDKTQLKQAVERAKNGDAEAFGEIYGELRHEAYRFALYYLHDENDAEDAVQNTALKTYRAIKTLNKPESFRSWFFRAEANECMDILRSRKKTAAGSDVLEDVADDSHERMYLSAELEEVMRTLSDEDRMIVELSVLCGFKSREIAETVGLRPSSVRSRLSRALRSMREKLEQEGAEK